MLRGPFRDRASDRPSRGIVSKGPTRAQITPVEADSTTTPSTRLRSLLTNESPAGVVFALRSLVKTGALDLPLPGGGRTSERFSALRDIAAADLSLARLAEGHVDAHAILAEAGRSPRAGLYGVWAADAPASFVEAERTPLGFCLHGTKKYASGARGIDRALVTAVCDRQRLLFDVPLDDPRIQPVEGSWQAVGMAATDSLDVVFTDVTLDASAQVGGSGFYLDRPGFWHGSVGVAACWLGGALGALRMVRERASIEGAVPQNEHAAAHLGAMAASCHAMQVVIDQAAREIDGRPIGTASERHTRALLARQVVEAGCQEVLSRAGRAGGTSPLVFDRAHARRAADLVVYLRQHHAERDLAALGHLVAGAACS